jgi:intein/homing endonuclease
MNHNWTNEEKERLINLFPKIKTNDLVQHFPNRTKYSIQSRAVKMDLKKPKSFYERKMPDIMEIEKAYLAGLFDGEGSVGLTACSQRGRISRAYPLAVSISNTHIETIKSLKNLFGGSTWIKKRRNKKYQPCMQWTLSSQQGLAFLKMIIPYLRIKKEQAEIGIKFINGRKRSSVRLSNEEIKRREKVRKKLFELKHPNRIVPFIH